MAQDIIIDTDPGQDDAVAILLALASPELNVLGLSVVAGNVPLSLTTQNALKICALAGRADLPVYAGCARPLQGPLVTAEHVHGKTGLNGHDLAASCQSAQSEHAVDFLIRTLMKAPPHSITLCALGPLTNIAAAFEKEPAIIARIKSIVLMGGGYFEGGNITPTAEFNIYVDPEAAHIVFKSGVDLTVAPLDVTHKALTCAAWIKNLHTMDTAVTRAVAGWTNFYERFDIEKYGSKGAPLHDPCVIAYLLKPDLFSGRRVNVEIELNAPLTRGMTVADWWYVTDRAPNCLFLGDVDRDGFFDLLSQRLGAL